MGQLREGLPERAMTRDISWGIPLPLDDPEAEGKVLYVWFDAPVGYISFTAKLLADRGESEKLSDWWQSENTRICHFIGEDNTVFHAITWPAMLTAEGRFQLPWMVVANAFLNERGADGESLKMSKSRMAKDSPLWVDEYLKTFDADPLRYYLTAIAPENSRGLVSIEDFKKRNNSELLATLGNFVNRSMTFLHKYFSGVVPSGNDAGEEDQKVLSLIALHQKNIASELDLFHFKAALQELMSLAQEANVYFDLKQPWKQRKDDLKDCGVTLHTCCQLINGLRVLMSPFLPASAQKCALMLNVDSSTISWEEAQREIKEGHHLGEASMLFVKLED